VRTPSTPPTSDDGERARDDGHPLLGREGLVRWTFGFAALGVATITTVLAADAGVAPLAAVDASAWLAAFAAVGAVAAGYRALTA
jgi:hypothetical protein